MGQGYIGVPGHQHVQRARVQSRIGSVYSSSSQVGTLVACIRVWGVWFRVWGLECIARGELGDS